MKKPLIKTNLPNFLIVGAAKSGTTSLFYYLKQHPEIFLPKIKEPYFMSTYFLKLPFKGPGDELVEQSVTKNWEFYQKLFRGATNFKAVGEADTDNLYYYYHAISVIKKFLGNPKIIIILRNPIDRAFSSYTHLIRDNREYLTFEQALKKETERIANNWESIWHYTKVGFYYNQVKSYIENFSNVKIYLFEDLREKPKELLRDIFRFLGVNEHIPIDVSKKYNISGFPKNKLLHNFLTKYSAIKPIIKLLIPNDEIRRKIKSKIMQKNLQKIPMDSKIREYLKNVFKEDILHLQYLIKRDLSHWLK